MCFCLLPTLPPLPLFAAPLSPQLSSGDYMRALNAPSNVISSPTPNIDSVQVEAARIAKEERFREVERLRVQAEAADAKARESQAAQAVEAEDKKKEEAARQAALPSLCFPRHPTYIRPSAAPIHPSVPSPMSLHLPRLLACPLPLFLLPLFPLSLFLLPLFPMPLFLLPYPSSLCPSSSCPSSPCPSCSCPSSLYPSCPCPSSSYPSSSCPSPP